ncbi:hypothetical protein MMPV_002194 [Pyropia vietnamensis]
MAAPQSARVFSVGTWLRSRAALEGWTHVSAPREVGCYSRDRHRTITYGSRAELKEFREPPRAADLYAGFSTFVPKTTASAPVEPIILAALAAGFSLERDADFVTYRNNLNKLMLVPYATAAGGDDWHIHAVLVGSTVYLDVVPWEEQSPHPAAARAAYSGVKFEALCTAPPPIAGADVATVDGDDAVDANAEFCSLVRLRVGRHRLLMSAEIDCYEPPPPDVPHPTSSNVLTTYRELKTMAVPRTPAQHARVKRQRLLKYWIQSYLVGVPELFIGFRNDRGELTGTMRVPTRALPDLAAAPGDALLPPPGWDPDGPDGGGGGPPWDPCTCVNALDALLDAIRSQCRTAGDGVAVRLSFAASRGVVTREACPDEGFGDRVRAALARIDVDDGGSVEKEGDDSRNGVR